MSESVLADFVAQVRYDDAPRDQPQRCRVLLNRERLVVVSGDRRTTIGLETIFDLVTSTAAEEMADYFDHAVRVQYAADGRRRSIVLEGDLERIDRFALILYKAILRPITVTVKHPVNRGGLRRDPPARQATVRPEARALVIDGDRLDATIDLSAVVDVRHVDRRLDDEHRTVVAVTYLDGRQTLVTELYAESTRRQNVLARFLERRLFKLEDALRNLTLGDEARQALVALYAGVERDRLHHVLDEEGDGPGSDVDEILAELQEAGLFEDDEEQSLARPAYLAVTRWTDDVVR